MPRFSRLSYCLFALLFFLLVNKNAFSQSSPPFICILDSSSYSEPEIGDSVPNGGVFTPKGDLRVLIVFVGVTDSATAFDPANFFVDGWPAFSGANYATVPNGVESSGRFLDLFYQDTSDFSTYANDTNVVNLSKLWHVMSKGQFRIMADVYKDPVTGLPARININRNITNRTVANRAVLDSMKAHDPLFDWSPYDNRQNAPNYLADNSGYNPDNKPDYIIFVYRLAQNISASIPLCFDSGFAGGTSTLSGITNYPYNGFTITGSGFFLGNGVYSYLRYGFLAHEISHEMYACPHYGNSNGVMGTSLGYFWQPNRMWGSMTQEEMCFQTMNAWERWIVGWTELETGTGQTPSDIQDSTDLPPGGIFEIRDYITTGDVIRIKLPYQETARPQYLWLENHQLKSHLDGPLRYFKNNGIGEPFGRPNPGLVGFIERINDTRNTRTNLNYVNSIKLLHSEGSFDWDVADSNICPPPPNWWGNRVYEIQTGLPNPISGQTPFAPLVADLDDFIPGYNSGCPDSVPPDGIIHWQAIDLNTGGSENTAILHRDGNYTYDLLGKNVPFGNVGDKIGIGTQSPATNYVLYNPSTQTDGITYLNGVSVEILARDSATGTLTIRVRYDDVDLNEDLRWCGRMVLKDIRAGTPHDLRLGVGNMLTIDRSGTPNRPTINSSNGMFVNETTFEVDSGATFYLDSLSILLIKQRSKLTVKSGGKLIVGATAQLYVQDGGILEVEDGGELIFEENTAGNIDANSTLILKGTQAGNGLLIGDVNNTGPAFIQIAGTLNVQAPQWTYNSQGNGYYEFTSSHNLVLDNAASVLFQGNANQDKVIRLMGTTLDLDSHFVAFRDCGVESFANSSIKLAAYSALFENVMFTGNSSSSGRALEGTNLPYLYLNNCYFSNYQRAVQLMNSSLGTQVFADRVSVQSCHTGMYFDKIQQLEMFNSDIENCVTGMYVGNSETFHLDDGSIRYCDIGISGLLTDSLILSNVLVSDNDVGISTDRVNAWLRNGTKVRESLYDGVNMLAPHGSYAHLTVGDYGCGWVYNNGGTGIMGSNLLLHINPPDYACNNYPDDCDGVSPNRFDGNGTSGGFGIRVCYTELNPPVDTLFAKYNYWDVALNGDLPYPGYVNLRRNCAGPPNQHFGIPVVTTPYWYNCEPINCIGCQGEPYVEMEFTVDEPYVMAGDSVRFSNLSDSAYSNFTWKFYGADTFSVAHADPGYVVYPTPGKYKVTLIGEKDFTWDSLSRQRYIVVDSIAPYTFSETESEYCAGDSLSLEMESVYLGKINWVVTRDNALEMLAQGTTLHIDSLKAGAYVILANCRYYDRDTTLFFDTVFVETCPEERLPPDAANQQDEEGISNLLQLAAVNLYPNPSPGGFTLEADFPMREILIYGLDGRIVQTYAEKAPKNQVQIGMDNTSAGIYLVKILFDNGFTQTLRFVRI